MIGMLSMANFCTKCGTPRTGRFCVKCGADISQSTTPAPPQPVQQNAGTASPEAVPVPVAGPPSATISPLVTNKRMSPLAKLGIAAVVVVLVGGALAVGGLYYAAHRISQKIHEEAGSILGSSPNAASPGSSRGGTGS